MRMEKKKKKKNRWREKEKKKIMKADKEEQYAVCLWLENRSARWQWERAYSIQWAACSFRQIEMHCTANGVESRRENVYKR